jgi:hypothetical protein
MSTFMVLRGRRKGKLSEVLVDEEEFEGNAPEDFFLADTEDVEVVGEVEIDDPDRLLTRTVYHAEA